MGKSAGNTPLELLAHWQNAGADDRYDLGELFAAIEDFVLPLAGSPAWGYRLPYLLAAIARVHPAYVLFLQNEKGVGAREAYRLLQTIPDARKLYFCRDTAERLCRTCSASALPLP